MFLVADAHLFVQAQLEQLWHSLAGEPAAQAWAVASKCAAEAPHLARWWYEKITRSIPDATFKRLVFSQPDDSRMQALNLLAGVHPNAAPIKSPAPPAKKRLTRRRKKITAEAEETYQAIFGVAPVVAEPAEPIRVDWEQGRLADALHQAAPFRLWALGRDLTRRATGSGVITRKALWQRLKVYHIDYTRRHFNRLLAGGVGLFWWLHKDNIYLRGTVKVSRDLYRLFAEDSRDLVGNLPGVRDMLVDPSGPLEQWEGTLYGAWFAGRGYEEDLTISRETLEKLFRRDATTLRRWERDRLAGILTRRTNYAQCPSVDRYFYYIPEHSQAYLAEFRNGNGQQVTQERLRWQLPNTYHVTLASHAHRGQAAKVRRAVRVDFPAVPERGGYSRLYYTFDTYKSRCKSAKFRMGQLGDVNRAVYVYLANQKRTKHGIFEISNSGFTFTAPDERVRPKHEDMHFAAVAARLAAFNAMHI